MGLFDKLKKTTDERPNELTSVVDGECVDLTSVKDEVFSSGMMGDGVGIMPSTDKIVSPGSGTINFVFPAKHAIGLTLDNGAQVIIHVGIDTVNLNGKGFESFVKDGTKVKRGDLLLKVDFELIKNMGYDITTMIIITNKTAFSKIETSWGLKTTKDSIITLTK